jgi:hypothetical protein
MAKVMQSWLAGWATLAPDICQVALPLKRALDSRLG